MKIAKSLFRARKTTLPDIRFEKQNLTSFAGIVVFQKLFADIDLNKRLSRCRPNTPRRTHASFTLLMRLLIVHALLGMRKLRDVDLYREDPVVKGALGVAAVPSVPTISRMLYDCDQSSVESLRVQNRDMVAERLTTEGLATVTLDFDGSVISTYGKAEGVAAGFNKKKGMRSYYPLFCTVAQTGQILDLLHRSGNVHDSNGAIDFVASCVRHIRKVLPQARIETRMDSAFFSEEMIKALEDLRVEYAISVPFERYHFLKDMIARRRRWKNIPGYDKRKAAFENKWKPKCWRKKARFIFVRTANPLQTKGPLQLDLFEPKEFGYDYKSVVTNKKTSIKNTTCFLEGRGSQEGVFGEIKSQGALAYIPCKREAANKTYMLCAIMAHNLCRELQMRTWDKNRSTNNSRAPLWVFEKIHTLRNAFICKAGRLTNLSGKRTLTLNKNALVERYLRTYLGSA